MKNLLICIILAVLSFHCSDSTANTSQSGNFIHDNVGDMETTTSDSLKMHLDMLGSEHGGDREAAIKWLAGHPAVALPRLRKMAIDDGQPWTAAGAIEVLGRVGDAEDVVLLESLCMGNGNRGWNAAGALAKHRDEAAFEALLRLASNSQEGVAGNGLVALGMRGDERGRKVLEKRLGDGSANIRWKAVRGLEQLGAGGSRGKLERALASESEKMVVEKLKEVLESK